MFGTYNGIVGVFADSVGAVLTGSHANGCGRVGVLTWSSANTSFGECDADGQEDGRFLGCAADGMQHHAVPCVTVCGGTLPVPVLAVPLCLYSTALIGTICTPFGAG